MLFFISAALPQWRRRPLLSVPKLGSRRMRLVAFYTLCFAPIGDFVSLLRSYEPRLGHSWWRQSYSLPKLFTYNNFVATVANDRGNLTCWYLCFTGDVWYVCFKTTFIVIYRKHFICFSILKPPNWLGVSLLSNIIILLLSRFISRPYSSILVSVL